MGPIFFNNGGMITITLQQAKARLNNLVEKAQAGEQIVLLRGSKVVATILPITENDLEIKTRLTDRQAEKFWKEVSSTKSVSFRSAKSAAKHLKNHS